MGFSLEIGLCCLAPGWLLWSNPGLFCAQVSNESWLLITCQRTDTSQGCSGGCCVMVSFGEASVLSTSANPVGFQLRTKPVSCRRRWQSNVTCGGTLLRHIACLLTQALKIIVQSSSSRYKFQDWSFSPKRAEHTPILLLFSVGRCDATRHPALKALRSLTRFSE